MVKYLIMVLTTLILFTACTPTPDTRPFPIQEAEQLMQHGNQLFSQGHYVESLFYFRRSVAHYRSLNREDLLLVALLNTAETSLLIGRLESSRASATEALALTEQTKHSEYAQRAALALAHIALLENNLVQAEHFVNKATHTEKDTRAMPSLLLTQIQLALARQDSERAVEYLNALTNANDSALFHARTLQLQAQLEIEPEQRLQTLLEALHIYQVHTFRPGIASVLSDIGDAYAEQENPVAAIAHWQRALYIRSWLSDSFRSRLLLEKLVNTAELAGISDQAKEYRTLLNER